MTINLLSTSVAPVSATTAATAGGGISSALSALGVLDGTMDSQAFAALFNTQLLDGAASGDLASASANALGGSGLLNALALLGEGKNGEDDAGDLSLLLDMIGQGNEERLVPLLASPVLATADKTLNLQLSAGAGLTGASASASPQTLLAALAQGLKSAAALGGESANLAATGETDADGTAFQSLLSNLGSTAREGATQAVAASVVSRDVQSPLNTSAWSQQFSQQVVWMAKNEVQSAQISINPEELGPVKITLHLNGDRAQVAFTSAHAEVRQAIQDALPQLKEMLAGAGIDLGQADVGSQAQHDEAQAQAQAQAQARSNAGGEAFDEVENGILGVTQSTGSQAAMTAATLRGRGLVDLFA